MIPIVVFSGPSGSGKTTLIEKVIKKLTAQNLRVGTVKHHIKQLDVDHEGKDSWRHKTAGAFATVIAAPSGVAAIRSEDVEPSPRDIVERYLYDADIVLVEGYKNTDLPNISVYRKDIGEDFVLNDTKKPSAVATDADVDAGGIPIFSLDDDGGIAEFIVGKFIENKSSRRVSMLVDDKPVPMKHFVRDLLEKTVRGMVSSFRGTEGAKKIRIMIDDEE